MTSAADRLVALGGTAVAVALLACTDPYAHTNPYDPLVAVDITISGPDTLFSYSEIGQYTATVSPSFPDTSLQWAVDTATIFKPGTGNTVVDGATILKPTGAGSFQAIAPPLEPMTYTLEVEALIGRIDTTVARCVPACITIQTNQYRHIGIKRVVLTQRVTHIQLRCPDTHVCDTLTVGDAGSVWVDGLDALNHPIVALTGATANPATGAPIATLVSRTPAIAAIAPVGIRSATITALAPGTSWIVATRAALFDSVLIVVK